MKSNELVQADIRDNKVKQGLLVKRSRHLKEWKERWMVLTKTHLYSFVQKGVYKDPTQTISLKEIQTLKSYYKNQYDRPYTFRIQSPEVNFHIYAKTNQEKWAWMTAIQRMTQRLIHPQNKSDTYNLIRETIKMSSAVRQTLQKKEDRKQSYTNFSDNDLKKFKLTMESQIYNYQIQQFVLDEKVNVRESQVFFNVEKKQSKTEESKVREVQVQKIVQKTIEVPTIVEKTVQTIVEKTVEVPTYIEKQKIVEKQVPVEKIVYEEKIVYVPEIRQKIVEKVVYKDAPQVDSGFLAVIEDALNHENQNPRCVIDFVIFLLTSKMKKYYEPVLAFCLKSPSQRFFAQKFLLMLNDETDEEKLNAYLKFLLILYENSEEYFYASDIKVLIDILLRQLEFIRSEFNQYLIMLVFKALAEKSWWLSTKHRKNDIKTLVRQLEASSGHDNQILAGQLLSKL